MRHSHRRAYIPVAKLIALRVAMALSGALWVFLRATDMGGACARRRRTATCDADGINPNRVFCVALAGIAWPAPPVRC